MVSQGLKIHEAQQKTLELHRDLITMSKLLQCDVYNIQNEGPFQKGMIGDSYLLGNYKPGFFYLFRFKIRICIIDFIFIENI